MSADTATGASPSHRWVQAGLVIVTAAELLDALSSVQSDYHLETDLLRFAQRLTSIKLALSPLLAGAALVFAALGNIRYAIFALAALTLTGWALDSLPSIVIHGFKPSFDFSGMEEFFFYLVAPIVTIAAVLLALKNQRISLASLLVGLPPLFKWAGVVLFITAVLIYSF
ncbi:MAG: hypothetical protein WA796_18270 [Pseudolabrys sp.]